MFDDEKPGGDEEGQVEEDGASLVFVAAEGLDGKQLVVHPLFTPLRRPQVPHPRSKFAGIAVVRFIIFTFSFIAIVVVDPLHR